MMRSKQNKIRTKNMNKQSKMRVKKMNKKDIKTANNKYKPMIKVNIKIITGMNG